ncbi:hypothetical protein [Nonomuraea typhae]|uniref:Tetracyclin repressor-like C-terminal domain-containing protein n=1 Tax=Nonomuraea typhae TaxID=2603600 RepID=A0ABW7YUT1_9ACTN
MAHPARRPPRTPAARGLYGLALGLVHPTLVGPYSAEETEAIVDQHLDLLFTRQGVTTATASTSTS